MTQTSNSYNGNIHVKRDGVTQQYTQEQLLEYSRCMKDPKYFARKYCKIINLDEGLVNFELYPYQEEMFDHFNDNRFSVVLACRQSGKSISSVAYLLWFAIFQSEKTVAILANKGPTAREMLGRITLMLENLPFFLQPGCKALNKGSIEFSNNSRIIASNTSSSSIRGMSVSLLYLDEFGFVENDEEFYTSTYPVISSGKTTKIIITSTANGIGNVFHNIWEGAITNTNEFAPFRVDWWDVPGRDEKWKEETIKNTSAYQFEQEYGNSFHGTGDTLFSGEALLRQRAIDPIEQREDGLVKIYKHPEEGHTYVMCVDVSKGKAQDYSTFNVIDISGEVFEQVATYRHNRISPILFPQIVHKYAKAYNEAYLVIESNDQGGIVTNALYYDFEYENLFMESGLKAKDLGLHMDRRTKRLGCSTAKDLVEEKKIIIRDKQTVKEMTTFVAKGQSFEASPGNHDDLVMTLVAFGYFIQTTQFLELSDVDIKKMLFQERMDEIEADVLPFAIIDDGLSSVDEDEIRSRPWMETGTYDF
jgi:hypothetical protein